MTRTLAVIAGAIALTSGLAGCGSKQDPLAPTGRAQSLTVMLDRFPNANHVGLYRAIQEGDFARAGLNVQIQVPTDPATPLQLLDAGKVDVAISYEPEVMLARDKGAPLAAIGAIVQQPLTSIVSLRSKHVKGPADLRGKRVGDAGIPYQHAYLETILARAHVPAGSVKEINVGANLVPAMIAGRVDATLGAYWSYEAIQLSQEGKHPNVIRVNDAGVPPYDELVLVARETEIANRTNLLRRFVQALSRGYESVRSAPQAGVNALVGANPSLDPRLQLAGVRATLGAFFPTKAGEPWGWQDPAQWNAYGTWMLGNHLISSRAAVADASTNELLAGQGL